jgi:hypothetical protein
MSRLLFVIKHPGYTRNFESTLATLAERGHEIHLAFEQTKKMPEADGIIARLHERHPAITSSVLPKAHRSAERAGTRAVRIAIDHLRYLEPRYADAGALRARVEAKVPPGFLRLARVASAFGPTGVRALRRVLQSVERRIPPAPNAARVVAQHAPNGLLITPLVGLASSQADYVRAARRSGVPSALLVHSWDNLSNKGLMRDVPDRVAVWNASQAAEAAELHGVPPERVVVTGANAFDHWFDRRPSRSREDFCAAAGLDPDRPYLLYVCSSPFIAPREVGFVRRWVGELRAGGGVLSDVGVLVRPHPQNAEQWEDDDLGDLPGVTVYPRLGAQAVDDSTRADYFDSIHHAKAVVGINTSAQIESAVLGRPVHTIVTEEFASTQTGTLHFHHLSDLLEAATSFPEHVEHLRASVESTAPRSAKGDRFLASFVRPFGLDEPATPRLVAAVEALPSAAGAPAGPARGERAALAFVRLLGRGEVRASRKRKRSSRRPALLVAALRRRS